MNSLSAYLAEANRILVFTGAGLSTGSGIPDYRGPQGVWKTRTPVYYQDFMGSPEARLRHWRMRLESREMFASARPNAAHHAIHRLEQAGRIECVVTQNVDGLHAAAGTSPDRMVEIHGSTQRVECQSCGWIDDVAPHLDAFHASGQAPLCACGGFLKTATISFGQSLKREAVARAEEAARNCDLVISLGSTLSVSPANHIPVMAAHRGVAYVIVNRGATDHDGADFVSLRLEGDVVEIFPDAVDRVLPRPRHR